MPYIGNITSDFSVDTGNITNRAVTALKLSPSSVGSDGQVLSVDGSGNLQWSADASGTALTGSTNNTITTVTGANAIQGEANLTFDGTQLVVQGGSGTQHLFKHSAGWGGITSAGSAGGSGAGFSLANNYSGTLETKWSIYLDGGTDALRFTANTPDQTGDERLRITSDGKVGIGTTSPTETLHVYQSAVDNVNVLLEQGNTNSGNLIQFKQTTTGSVTRTAYIGHGGDATGQLMIQNSGNIYLQTGGSSTALTIDATQNSTFEGWVHLKDNKALYIGSANDLSLFHDATDCRIRYNHAVGSLKFQKNDNSDVMVLDGNGNVGIGTTSPSSIFHVQQSGGTQFRFDNDYFYIKSPDGGNRYFFGETQNDKSAQLSLYDSSNAQKVRITAGDGASEGATFFNGGKVGIGTTSPSKKLEITTTGTSGEGILLKTTDNTYPSVIGDSNRSGAGLFLIALQGFWDGKRVSEVTCESGPDTTNKDDGIVVIRTRNHGDTSPQDRVTVDEAGNVGINTTSMTGRLNVQGSAGGVALQTTDATNSTFRISHPSAAVTLLAGGSSQHLALGTGFAEKMRINTNGDVGIGTTDPTKPSSSNNSTRFMEIASGDGADLILSNNVSTNIGAGAHIGTLAFKNIDDTDSGAVPHYAGIRCESANTSGSMDLRFYVGRNNLESDAPNMIIDSAGQVGIGTASPSSAKLHVIDGVGTTIKVGNTTNASTGNIAYNWGGSFGLKCDPDNNAGGTKHIYMQVIGSTFFNLSSTGKVTCTGVNSLTTTGGSAVYVESDGDLLRYTSSRKYKTDIETAEDKYADEILTCRPVWYRSTSTNDIKDSSKTKSDFGWFGFIAEEIAEINPRLVNYKTKESQQQSDGTLKSVELDPSAYEAESVRYTDFIPLMVNLLKRQAAKIETLETKVAALESA